VFKGGPHEEDERRHRESEVDVHQVLALDLDRPETPGVLGTVVPDLHHELAVEHDDPRVDAGEQRVEVHVGPVELHARRVEHLVDDVELVVGRLLGPRRAVDQGVKRYPTDHTVSIQRGCAGSISMRVRKRRTCSVTVAVPSPSSTDHTCAMICLRVNT
jgi:hypothetical protein